MHRILLVDDEEFIRTSIIESISWENYDLEIICATNGYEALDLIKSTRVDIMIVDIKMPLMGGIELIRRIRSMNIITEIIVLSCYNEFELVREAMTLGTCDYLFKPSMLPEDILNSIQKAEEKIAHSSNKEASAGLEQIKSASEEKLMQDFFLKLLHGHQITLPEREQQEESYKEVYRNKDIMVLILKLIHFKEGRKDIFQNDMYLMKESINNVMQELFTGIADSLVLNINYYEYGVILAKSYQEEDMTFCCMVTAIIQEIQRSLYQYYQIRFAVGASGYARDIMKLADLYQEALLRADMWVADNSKITIELEEVFANMNAISKDLANAIVYIQEHYGDKELSLESVAGQIGVSRNYFSRIFKKALHVNFIDYLTDLRVKKAKYLYETTDLRIYEIADMVGYSDWRYFYNVYKKRTGHSLSKEQKSDT